MKRRLLLAFLCCLMVMGLALPASAESTASQVDCYMTVNSEGTCTVSMTVSFHLEAPDPKLQFPLPARAKNITMNGTSARTHRSSSAVLVDVGDITGDMVGDLTVQFGYTLSNTVTVTEVSKTKMLRLDLPILSGFSYPVQRLSFIITLPGTVTYNPSFYSVYLQDSFQSAMERSINGNMITGASTAPLNDHESVGMAMYVTQEMFPGVSMYVREGEPELPYIIGFAVAALVYWLLFLRTWPLRRTRSVSAPQGISAGEVGCHLTLAGGDLTMMVIHWAQLGYILIQLDGGRVLLHRRMDMGNERSHYEMKIFRSLFGDRRVVDATGSAYARLHQKVAASVSGERDLLKRFSGNMKLFRALLCGSQAACGVCVAMNMTGNSVLQILLAVVLGIFGLISGWQIQEMAYRTHLRGKTRVYIGLVMAVIWIGLGILCGQWIIPLVVTLVQYFMGYFAAYGGRRSDVGRHDAGRILGLRHYLRKISVEDIRRLMKSDPDYFFNMAPYALALGIIHPFARNFGARQLDQCPYILTRVHGKRTADEWADMMAQTADRMDARQRKLEYEKWTRLPGSSNAQKRRR